MKYLICSKPCALGWELKTSETRKQNSWSSESLKFGREPDDNQSQDNVFIQDALKEWLMQQTFHTPYKVIGIEQVTTITKTQLCLYEL